MKCGSSRIKMRFRENLFDLKQRLWKVVSLFIPQKLNVRSDTAVTLLRLASIGVLRGHLYCSRVSAKWNFQICYCKQLNIYNRIRTMYCLLQKLKVLLLLITRMDEEKSLRKITKVIQKFKGRETVQNDPLSQKQKEVV